jgi:hypothetical protein
MPTWIAICRLVKQLRGLSAVSFSLHQRVRAAKRHGPSLGNRLGFLRQRNLRRRLRRQTLIGNQRLRIYAMSIGCCTRSTACSILQAAVQGSTCCQPVACRCLGTATGRWHTGTTVSHAPSIECTRCSGSRASRGTSRCTSRTSSHARRITLHGRDDMGGSDGTRLRGAAKF